MVMLSVSIQAKSFSADAVQIRNGQFSHARMFWSDGNVRFEYLDNGVPMVQIYDLKNKKIIWLDTENKLFVQDDLDSEQAIDSMLKENKTSSNPCELLKQAECTRLKEVNVKGRKAVKWLVTTQMNGRDQHTFQWIDKKYNVVVRQENSDNSIIEVTIDDDQEMNGRKVRKLSISMESDGIRSSGTQWYDAELNIIVRQHYQNGAEDELRNIKVEKVGKDMFAIPEGYKLFDAEALASEPNSSDINGAVAPMNN
jgi:outer membrane lipoprotein-sorting protein